MDVLETKYLSTDLNFMYKLLQFNNNPVRLVGTGSMASQYYPADFDFLCQVKKRPNLQNTYKEFKRIIDNIYEKNNFFFIEFKIQQLAKGDKEPEKHKIFKRQDLTLELFQAFFNNDTELCKIDAIIFFNGVFKEVSCIYFFSNKPLNMNDYIKALLEDQEHYYDEGKYYKSLKRLMLSAKYANPPDKSLIILITRFFNSMVGKLYELDNELQACEIYRGKFGDNERVKMFIRNIGLDGLEPSKLKDLSKDYQNLINGEALKFYSLYKLPVGHLPVWGSRRIKI